MNNNAQTVYVALIETLLPQIEGRKTAKEVLAHAWEICQQQSTDEQVIEISKKVQELKEMCDQGFVTETDARDTITEILLMLIK